MAWILASVLGPVCKRMMDGTIEEYKLVRDVKDEIMNLRRTVFVIKRKLEVAEGKQVESHVIHERLKELKQVLFDAEDVFDEIATDEALERDAEEGTSRLPKVRKLNICGVDIPSSSSAIAHRRAIAHRVKDINKKFNDILRDEDMLGLHVSDVTSSPVIRPIRRPPPDTSSLLPKGAHIIGREDEMQKIKELILLEYSVEGTVTATSDNYKNVHVISVVGMGGVGKTTLVQHAYNSPAVAEYFQLRMWVCVSNYFDVKRITREIIDASLSSSKETRDEFADTSNWDVVQNRLKGKLEGKRFLLVLDDVWEEDPSEWNELCTPLMYGGKGSKIIVTTRSQAVSNITKGTPIFLKDLPSDDLWSIFQTFAFDGHDPNENSQLAIVGRQIVDKLKGSPLAAKTIGRLLNLNRDVKHWKNIMKSKTWMSSNSKNSIVPILKLSYDYLPGHLKQCFAYCSLFPEDHHFNKDELVKLWMAQQFIYGHAESMGGEYFDDLACMSLFEKNTDVIGQERIVMHDLIHNLAEIVSEEDCLRLEDNQHSGTISGTVRHVSIASHRFGPIEIEQLCNKCENMRTLLFLRGCNFQLEHHLHSIFMKMQRLRVLGLSRCGIKELPESIGTLKHLRFLDLSNNLINKLPESLCDLHNLQVLNLFRCDGIRALPRNMSALINLRHLTTNDSHLVSGIEGLGKLTALHDCARQPMKELADMGMLRRLLISSLEKVKSTEEAAESRLDKKEHLDELTLKWSDVRDDNDDDDKNHPEVLDSLQPSHSSIKRLSISNYRGSRSPRWMEDQSWVLSSSLEALDLERCTNWEVLPPLGQLLCLDSLKIEGMETVRRIGPTFMGCCRQVPQGGFPSLQVLKFKSMPEWEEWEVPLRTDDDSGEDGQVFLARLRELTIWDCPKLRQLPPLPPTLTKLEIRNVGLTHLPEWWLPPSSSVLPCCSSSSTSLSSLVISGCPELTSLAGGLLRHPLPNLVKLELNNCRALVSLPPDTFFGHLPSLKELVVARCPKLAWPSTCESPSVEEEDTGVPPSLESVTIEEVCSEIVDQMMLAIVGSRQKLACLTYLKIEGCFSRPPPPTLWRSLPSSLQDLTIRDNDQLDDETLSAWLRGLTSLRELSISDCPAVTSLPRAEVLSHLTALKKLEIKRLKALSSFGGGIHCLVSLEELTIGDCPELLDITTTTAADSSRPSSSLAALRPSSCSSSSPSLSSLEIRDCRELTSLADGLLRHPLPNIVRWKIIDCPKLRQLPPLPPTLTELEIVNVGLSHLPEWWLPSSSWLLPSSCSSSSPCSLSSLDIRGCPELTSLADGLLRHPLPNLVNWIIIDCPKLRQLPPLPPTLTKLIIRNAGLTHFPGWRLLPSSSLPCCCPSSSSSSPYSLCSVEISDCPNLEGNDDGEDDQVLSEAPPLPPRRQHHRRPLFLARLRELTIWNCPKLRQLPPLPPALTQLEIVNVGLTHLPEWWLPPSSTSSLLPCCSSSSPSLSSLEIYDCQELTSLADGLLRHPLPNLVELKINSCRGLVSLPVDRAFGHLTSLKELVVARCPKLAWPSVEEDTGLPPSLESITIEGVCGEVMDQMMLAIVDSSQKLACLRKLDIMGCFSRPLPPTLRRSLPSSLQDITIYNNDQLDGETLSAWLRGLTSLRRLYIRECPAMTSLPRAEVLSLLTALKILQIERLKALSSFGGGIHCLVSLEELDIGDCPELLDVTTTAADSSRPSSSSALPSPAGMGTSTTRIRKLEISESSMQQIKRWLLQCPFLQHLSISRCPQLTGFGGNNDGGDDVVGGELEAALLNLSGTLHQLDFWGCDNIRSLPPRLRCLSSLQSLRIEYCPQIPSLPVAGLPESLRELEIRSCPALEERCKEAGEGSDWPLISHVPSLLIFPW